MDHRDLIIIGSGPAGLTAALYSARANLRPLLIEGVEAGGQLMLTTIVENFPGYRDGILGPDLMAEMRAQAERFGTEMIQGNVTTVDVCARPIVVRTAEAEYTTRTLIIATGASARMLGLPSERTLMGHGVSTCATCDGYFFRGHEIAVVGGGDSAMEEAVFLTQFATKVTVVHRRDTLRASKIMQDKARANPKIAWLLDTEVDEIQDGGKGEVTAMVVRNRKTGGTNGRAGERRVRGHRPHAEHVALPRSARDGCQRLHHHTRRGQDQRRRRVRLRRRPGPRVSAGDHRRRDPAAWPRSTRNGISSTFRSTCRHVPGTVGVEPVTIDPSSPEDDVSVVEDERLAGRDRDLRRLEGELDAGVSERRARSPARRGDDDESGRSPPATCRRLLDNPVHAGRRQRPFARAPLSDRRRPG